MHLEWQRLKRNYHFFQRNLVLLDDGLCAKTKESHALQIYE
jgi:hypothetical protein